MPSNKDKKRCPATAASTKSQCKRRIDKDKTACHDHVDTYIPKDRPESVELRHTEETKVEEEPVKQERQLVMELPYNISCRNLAYGTVQELYDLLRKGPETDTPKGQGYIYMFQLKNDVDSYFKIGHSVDPDRRMEEWDEIYAETAKIKHYRCKRRVFAESIIHKVLDDCRMWRCSISETEISSFWYRSKRPVADAHFVANQHTDLEATKALSLHNGKEWFHGNKADLLGIIHQIILEVNHLWSDEPWKDEYSVP
ncbi:MAG: GIY-YIG nuclease family protein [Promethearchaeota archaeon]